jgi:hypothetical protein
MRWNRFVGYAHDAGHFLRKGKQRLVFGGKKGDAHTRSMPISSPSTQTAILGSPTKMTPTKNW